MNVRLVIGLAGLALALGGCPAEDSGGNGTDMTNGGSDIVDILDGAIPDMPPDLVSNDTAGDPQPDPVVDAAPDAEPDAEPEPDVISPVCTEYPTGPYAFTGVDDVVAPMSWPNAIAGADETLAADFEAMRCDPNVHSIFIQISSTSCPSCPPRMSEIGELAETWETYGAKWIFLVPDADSVAAANTYVDRYVEGFGWRSNDSDNSEGAYTIASSPAFAAQPWTGVIRTSDMVLVYDEPDDAYLDLEAIAEYLAGE